MDNPALNWVMEVQDGKRMINGFPAEEFIAALPKADLLKVVVAGLMTLNDFTAPTSQEPEETGQN